MSDPIVTELVARLTPDLQEAWHERAGIMEFDGGLDRERAEALALLLILQQYPKEVCSCLQR